MCVVAGESSFLSPPKMEREDRDAHQGTDLSGDSNNGEQQPLKNKGWLLGLGLENRSED